MHLTPNTRMLRRRRSAAAESQRDCTSRLSRAIGAVIHRLSTRYRGMKTVLLIDDDNVFLLAIGVRLKAMGYTVYAAKDAVNAISAVRKNNPDVIVLDVSLPAGDGFMVAERLQ